MLQVNEIYNSLQGEGLRAGAPTVFMRMQGCSLRCKYCDTPYALLSGGRAVETGEGFFATWRECVDRVKQTARGVRDVCITGGEPLEQDFDDALSLVYGLAEEGFYVVIETGGHVSTEEWIKDIGSLHCVHFCVDYKLPGSRMLKRMKPEAFSKLRDHDSIKYTVWKKGDFPAAVGHLSRVREQKVAATALFSPVFGAMSVLQLAEMVMNIDPDLHPVRLSLQQHKMIWPPNQRRT